MSTRDRVTSAARRALPPFARRFPPIPEEGDYTSRLRSVDTTVRVGRWLGICVLVCFLTGLYSHFVQHPLSWLTLPHRPVWIYRVTQGLHVTSGIAAIPLLGMKLWVVTPKFWQRPLFGGILRILERGSILVLIASVAFELISGLLNVAEFYPWTFFFPTVHYAVAWIAIGSVIVHIAVKLPVIRTVLGAGAGGGRASAPPEGGRASVEGARQDPDSAAISPDTAPPADEDGRASTEHPGGRASTEHPG
ncbi:MAG: cytochrome b/b6 domain-containing protein, partial [Nakamurella sp.]